MELFDFLSLKCPDVRPGHSKIHLATWDGRTDPLNEYFAGTFNAWQCWQSMRNFGRKYVISLIRLGGSRWLFAGVYLPQGAPHEVPADPVNNYPSLWKYDLEEDPRCSDLNGRLIVSHNRRVRAPYRDAETCAAEFMVYELRPDRMSVSRFPGFKSVLLTKGQLETVFKEDHESWRTALSSVAGVYLITDTQTGKLYVGSATGEGGIWARWSSYAANGHGGNAELRKLISAAGADRSNYFQYSVLEIADTHASSDDVLQRESHWKKVLLTREYGMNAN